MKTPRRSDKLEIRRPNAPQNIFKRVLLIRTIVLCAIFVLFGAVIIVLLYAMLIGYALVMSGLFILAIFVGVADYRVTKEEIERIERVRMMWHS